MMRKIILPAIFVLVIVSSVLAQDRMTAKRTTAEEAVKSALNVGGKMPSFTLLDAGKKSVSSGDLLKQGNLVLVFYRGAWCPFCNLYLRNLQKSLGEIKANGGKLVVRKLNFRVFWLFLLDV